MVGPLLVPAAVLACVNLVLTSPDGAIDFRAGIWQPAFDILHGRSPYPAAGVLHIRDGVPSIYPPFVALLAIPFGLLSFALASTLWAALMIAALVLNGGCGVSLRALASKLGAPDLLATSLPLAVAAALLVCAWRLSHGLEGDRRSFSAAMGAVVVAAPVVWSHYLVYLIVPLALAAPRLEWRWFLLALPWVFGQETSLTVYLAHTGGRIVPTASFVGTDTHLVMLEYLLATAAVVLLTMRASAARGSRVAGTRNRWARARAPAPAAAVARGSL